MSANALLGHSKPTWFDADGIRYLHFEGCESLQGAMALRQPVRPVFLYIQQMLCWRFLAEPTEDTPLGILGLGAGALLRFCFRTFLQSPIEVVEYNPQVIELCLEKFRIPHPGERVQIFAQEAQAFLKKVPDAHYQALMVDLYDANTLETTCSSAAFYADCARVVRDQGVACFNLMKDEGFQDRLTRIQTAFDGGWVVVLPITGEGNVVVLASRRAQLSEDAYVCCQRWEQRYKFPSRPWLETLEATLMKSVV